MLALHKIDFHPTREFWFEASRVGQEFLCVKDNWKFISTIYYNEKTHIVKVWADDDTSYEVSGLDEIYSLIGT